MASEKISVFLLFSGVLEFLSKSTSFGIEINNKCSALFHKVKGKTLSGHIISVHQVSSEMGCTHKCLSSPKCASFNFEIQQSPSLSTCELNAVSKMSSNKKLKSRHGFAYYEPFTPRERQKQEIAVFSLTTRNLITQAVTTQGTQEVSLTQDEAAISPSSVPSTQPATIAAPVSNCGKHWHAYKSGCLRLFEDHKDWVAANAHCATLITLGKGIATGRLISIFSQNDNDRIVNLTSSLSSTRGDYFIGLNDKQTEGTYMWVQGPEATSFKNWHSSFPKSGNAESNRDCVIMSLTTNSDNGKWNTNQCTSALRFICECPDGPCAK